MFSSVFAKGTFHQMHSSKSVDWLLSSEVLGAQVKMRVVVVLELSCLLLPRSWKEEQMSHRLQEASLNRTLISFKMDEP